MFAKPLFNTLLPHRLTVKKPSFHILPTVDTDLFECEVSYFNYNVMIPMTNDTIITIIHKT